jgi:cell division protein FtsX
MIPSIRTESVVIESENMVRFGTPDLTPEQIKNLKVGIINSIRELFELDPNHMSAAFLLEKQRSESAIQLLAEVEQKNLGHITQIEIYKDYIRRIHMILGWMTITLAAAILVAAAAVVSRWLC